MPFILNEIKKKIILKCNLLTSRGNDGKALTAVANVVAGDDTMIDISPG
jgi:hypothetical protein